METNVPLSQVPLWVFVALGALALVQLSVEVWAIVDLVRRPVEQVVGGRKWLWAVLILFVNLVGAIVYFAAGRKPAPVVEQAPAAPASERASGAVDRLYGAPRDGEGR